MQLIEGINAIEPVICSFIQKTIRPAHKCRRCVSKQALKRIVNSSSSGGGGQVDRDRCPSLRLYNQGPLSAPQYYHQYRVRASDSCKLPPNTTNQPPSTAITTGRQKARKACICKFSLLQVSSTKAKRPKFHINKSASDKTNWLQTSHLILNFPPPNISLKAQPKQFN